MQALAQANRVRLARAEIKRQVAEGEITAADVVLGCPWEAESMTIADLLLSQHRWGRTRTRRFLARIPMSETKTIGSMSLRQRQALADALEASVHTSARPSSGPTRDEVTGWLARLAEVARRHADLDAEQRELMSERDSLVRQLSDAGLTRRQVAEAAGLTVARVQQIVSSPLPSTSSPNQSTSWRARIE